MAPPIHYTQQPSKLAASLGTACIRVHGGGFVTREMLEQTADDLRRELRASPSSGLLVDLREVAGYETSCLAPALQFLREAAGLGLRRIALVASSSVLRTASRVASQGVLVELRTFDHEPSAAQWLLGPGVVMARTHHSSSSASAAAP
ncbi:SpoIIAA family protein [Paraliomyxa miuraensis]|uniref:STAS/SEC14 domain-containing protein n=1 Tax=Paraliomyxa miuraensis TaxID=376150 RepID=UPI0022568B9D|nr:STAS/SEC14 domain-containing protein [Paraliomyxa miuraensis]MCX4243206.1 STAS/SEC14 domain-containing protein [Paraliomyxa miuraensis]